MSARMERKSASHDITFCVSECKNKCMRHISNYTFKEDELVSLEDFNCIDDDIKRLFEAIQYFRENLDWFYELKIDTDKLRLVLNLAERGIKLEKENLELKKKLFEENEGDMKKALEEYFNTLIQNNNQGGDNHA